MSKLDIIRAWKDEEYRESLNSDEQNMLPANPAGQVELTAGELEDIDGGTGWPCLSISLTFGISVQICYSIYNGGTCQVTTFGCC